MQSTSALLAIALLGFVGFAAAASSDKVQCVDDDGKPVDWMVVYKIPKLDKAPLTTGYEYATITSNSKSGKWVLSSKKTTDSQSVFGLNFGPAYKDKSSGANKLSSIIWSDQPEGAHPSAGYAHAKGVLIADGKSGLIFTHSIPQFTPAIEGKLAKSKADYAYPPSGTGNGQTAICISFDSEKTLPALGEYIYIVRPFIYSSIIKSDVATLAPKLQTLVTEKRHQKSGSNDFQIQSAGGMKFRLFAKSADDKVEFYSAQVAPGLGANMIANTWLNGAGGKLPSECRTGKKVEKVADLELHFENSDAVAAWPNSRDHSKWAVASAKDGSDWVCIADVNRMKSQEKRGGGAICFQNKNVHDTFVASAATIEAC